MDAIERFEIALRTQFETLERPDEDEAIRISSDLPLDGIVDNCVRAVRADVFTFSGK